MTYAVIRLGGKQFKIKENDIIQTEHQENADLDVLMFTEDENIVIGNPLCEGIEVVLTKTQDFRGKKVRIARFKAKSRYNKVNSHRQPYSSFKVEYIGKKGGYTAKTVKKSEEVKVEQVKEKNVEKKIKLPKIIKKKEKPIKDTKL